MDKTIRVIIVANESVRHFLWQGLSRYEDILLEDALLSLKDASEKISDMMPSMIPPEENPVLLLYSGENFDTACLCGVLNEKKLHHICLCDNFKKGFSMLQKGASEMIVLKKPQSFPEEKNFFSSLRRKIAEVHELYSFNKNRMLKYTAETHFQKIIAMGSSTGGTETLFEILKEMPENAPPILAVQHMPAVFTRMYAERVNAFCKVSVWEAQDGDELKPGLALIAPGDKHMTLAKKNGRYYVKCQAGEKVHNQCPAVDVLFESVARLAGKMSIGVILTGMGADGAKGLLEIRNAGGYTLGQDEDTSVVYGMPKAAFDMGAVMKQVPLQGMVAEILEKI